LRYDLGNSPGTGGADPAEACLDECPHREMQCSRLFSDVSKGYQRRGEVGDHDDIESSSSHETGGVRGTSTCPHQVLVMRVNPTSSQREMTMVPRQHALQLVKGARAAPLRLLPSMKELNALQTTVMQRSLLRSMVEAGGGPQLGIPQAADQNQPGSSQPQPPLLRWQSRGHRSR
jgi:hypothetical protein